MKKIDGNATYTKLAQLLRSFNEQADTLQGMVRMNRLHVAKTLYSDLRNGMGRKTAPCTHQINGEWWLETSTALVAQRVASSLTVRTVRRNLNQLLELGIIEAERTHAGLVDGRNNLIKLSMDPIVWVEAKQEPAATGYSGTRPPAPPGAQGKADIAELTQHDVLRLAERFNRKHGR
jgi:hypothetical protein